MREALTIEKLVAMGPAEAAALFIARRAEGLNDHEQRLLDEWLERDAAHRREFENAERVWQAFADSGDDEVLAAMRAQALAPRPRPATRWWPLAAAASLLLLIGAMMYFNSRAPLTTSYFVSARGQVTEHQLPDGSRMTLDADSAASGTFSDELRNITLERGRALFTVQPDASRPFSVDAADHRIVAIGTRFDVNLGADGLTVTLIEGKVSVASADPSRAVVTLTPGQQYIERDGRPSIKNLDGGGQAVTWQDGLVSFDDQTLAAAVAEMNRYSRDQIVIREADLAALKLSGQFRAGDAGRFAETLAEMHGLKVVRRGNEIELVRPK